VGRSAGARAVLVKAATPDDEEHWVLLADCDQ
jgi:hypothetical protein